MARHVVQGPGGIRIELDVNVTRRVKAHLAAFSLTAATDFAREAVAIEDRHGQPGVPAPERHMSAVLASVVLTAAFVEGGVNEIYRQAVDRDPEVWVNHGESELSRLSQFWERKEGQRAPTLKKCQVALEVVGKPQFKPGEEPYQSAAAVFAVRNAIMHFKPEWDTEDENHVSLEQMLSGRFPENRFVRSTRAFFPHRALGGGLARWTCLSAIAFMTDFVARLGIASPLRSPMDAARAALK